jgi:uncharacterized SAM-binding protein YcdF (DUF218 family)
MLLRALLTFLVVPPVNLVGIGMLGLALTRWRWYRRAGVAIVAVSLSLLLILAIPAVAQALIVSLEQDLPLTPPAGAPPRAIVVLSAELDRVRGSDGFDVGQLTLQRLRAAATLARRVHLPVLVSGGTVRGDTPPMATVMAKSLTEDFGVPVRWQETRSRTTWENAADSAAILEPLGIHSVYVVTHAWHEKRAVLAFRHFGLTATAAPVELDRFSTTVLPEAGGWVRSSYALHEWFGYVWYWLVAHISASKNKASTRKIASWSASCFAVSRLTRPFCASRPGSRGNPMSRFLIATSSDGGREPVICLREHDARIGPLLLAAGENARRWISVERPLWPKPSSMWIDHQMAVADTRSSRSRRNRLI